MEKNIMLNALPLHGDNGVYYSDIIEDDITYYVTDEDTSGYVLTDFACEYTQNNPYTYPASNVNAWAEILGFTDRAIKYRLYISVDYYSRITVPAKITYNNTSQVTVMFDSNGGSYVEPQILPVGSTPFRPANPVRQGYIFMYWTADGHNRYKFNAPVNRDITLYAVWAKEGGGGNEEGGGGNEDEDISGTEFVANCVITGVGDEDTRYNELTDGILADFRNFVTGYTDYDNTGGVIYNHLASHKKELSFWEGIDDYVLYPGEIWEESFLFNDGEIIGTEGICKAHVAEEKTLTIQTTEEIKQLIGWDIVTDTPKYKIVYRGTGTIIVPNTTGVDVLRYEGALSNPEPTLTWEPIYNEVENKWYSKGTVTVCTQNIYEEVNVVYEQIAEQVSEIETSYSDNIVSFFYTNNTGYPIKPPSPSKAALTATIQVYYLSQEETDEETQLFYNSLDFYYEVKNKNTINLTEGVAFAYGYFGYAKKCSFSILPPAVEQYHIIYAEFDKSVLPNTFKIKIKNNQASKKIVPYTFRQDVLSAVKTGVYQMPLWLLRVTNRGIQEVTDLRKVRKSIYKTQQSDTAKNVIDGGTIGNNVTTPTQEAGDSSQKVANCEFVCREIQNEINK